MTKNSGDLINIPIIIEELQASFDDDRYAFRQVRFAEGADEETEMIKWREEMHETWEQLVRHTVEVWDFAWQHTFDSPRNDRAEWLFRRKESPFRNCGLEDCLQVVSDAAFMKSREVAQFFLFIHAVLAQGSTMWSYSECKNESELEWPAPSDNDGGKVVAA